MGETNRKVIYSLYSQRKTNKQAKCETQKEITLKRKKNANNKKVIYSV